MSKTSSLQFNCEECKVASYTNRQVEVTVDKPDVEAILQSIDKEDVFEHVRDNYDPEDVFDESQLIKWAEYNGYVKE